MRTVTGKIVFVATAVLVGAMFVASPAVQAARQSARSKFVDACLRRVENHDRKVFNDCYTSDYLLTGGPETYAAPGRTLRGRNAVQAKMTMGKGDTDSWDSIDMVWTDLAESGDTLVRHLHQQFKGPRTPSYAGFSGLPRDLSFPVDVIIVYTFKNNRIASEFFQYDSLGFMLDLAQGDPQKIATALAGMKPAPQAGAAESDKSFEARVQALEDQYAIQQLVVAKYATALDLMDMKAYANLFTDDGELNLGGMVMKGHGAIEKMFSAPPGGAAPPTMPPTPPGVRPMPMPQGPMRPRMVPHVITNTSYQIDGDTAKGICYWSEIMLIDGLPGIVNMGHYEDELRKVNGEWKFAKRTIVRDVPEGTLIAPPPGKAP